MKFFLSLLLSAVLFTACNKGSGGSGAADIDDASRTGSTPDPDAQIPGTPGEDPNTDGPSACSEKIGLDKFAANAEVIIGDNTWVSTTTLSDQMMKANAQATVYVRMSASRCTGFLVNDDMIMTNNHCVANSSQARGVYARFNWVANNGQYEQYACDQFVMTNSGLDYTLLKCKGSPGKKHPKVVLAEFTPKTNDNIYVTHQNCDYRFGASCVPTQKLSDGVILGHNSSTVRHNADTLGGSSGSPIFDKDSHKVVAIHNAGINQGSNNGGTNFGVPMYRIVSDIQSRAPSLKIFSSSSRSPAYDVCD